MRLQIRKTLVKTKIGQDKLINNLLLHNANGTVDVLASETTNYCKVERNGTREIAAPIARPDHRKSKFGLRQGIKLT